MNLKTIFGAVATLLAITTMAQSSIHEFKVQGLSGETINRADYKGKKILVVNTASKCGFTPQYEELQELYAKNSDKMVVIGFPANNFGKQEPGSNNEIETFCKKNYGVTFPMGAKVSVKGKDIDPLFQWLNGQENPDFKGDIRWNFEKYLLDEDGVLIHRYRSRTSPTDEEIIGQLK